MTILSVTDENFIDEVIEYKGMVMVEFYSPKCDPCIQIASSVKWVAEYFKDTLKVVKMDCLENLRLPPTIGITSYPTFLFYKDGVPVHKYRGAPANLDMESVVNEAFHKPSLAG